MAKVCLVHVNSLGDYPPLGLMYIGTVLKNAGHKVTLIDNTADKIPFDRLCDAILHEKPDFIGITTLTQTFPYVLELCKQLKARDDSISITLGGHHVSAIFQEDYLNYADYIICGEGEYSFLHLVDGKPLQTIPGLIYKEKDKIRRNPIATINNLDDLPIPDRSLIKGKNYVCDISVRRKPATSAITSRGCPYNCIFCSIHTVHGYKLRQRSVNNVCDEIEYLLQEGYKEVYFVDDNFTLNNKWVVQLCNQIRQRKLDVAWKCLGRVDSVNEEMLRAMKKAGCYMIQFGMESANQETLNFLRKRFTPTDIVKAANLCKKVGIDIWSFWIISPFENELQTLNTYKLATKLNTFFADFFNLKPLPGTDLWNLMLSEDVDYRKGDNVDKLRQKYFSRLRWLLKYPHMWRYWFHANKNLGNQPFKLISKLHHMLRKRNV
jgi:radical SAM superfamily enzyme YgiQ (UPF0313 family)